MSTTVDQIVTEALMLPAPARAFVAQKLIESLTPDTGEELSDAWRHEVRRRCRALEQGLVELRAAEEVFARAYAALE